MFEKTIDIINKAIFAEAFSGAALAVGINNRLLLCQVFGQTKYPPNGKEIVMGTLFDMASLSKIVSTTMLALHFIEAGKLRLWDKLALFLPVPEDKKDITIKQLMTHTSGLPPHILLKSTCNHSGQAMQFILGTPLVYKPGSQEQYSCIGYILLGLILEQISNAKLDILAKREVFIPLSMLDTCYNPAKEAVYTEKTLSGKWLSGTVHDENARFLGGVAGNAGVFSTIKDMARFAQMLACEGNIGDRQYLSHQLLHMAVQNYTAGMAENRGLGFKLFGGENHFFGNTVSTASFGHTGFTGTSLLVDPLTHLYIVFLSNRVHPVRTKSDIAGLRNLLHSTIAADVQNGVL